MVSLMKTVFARRVQKTAKHAVDRQQSASRALAITNCTTMSASKHAQTHSTLTVTTHANHVTLRVRHATDQTAISA